MVGQERVLLPLIAEHDFGITSRSAVLAFIVSFGLVKAITNVAAGHYSDRWGRRRLLIIGWLAGLPVAPLLVWAPTWAWIVAANGLLGVNQGLCWSTTVIMKIDLVGPARRGLAMGLNEFAGYVAVSLAAFATGWLAAETGNLRHALIPGIGIAAMGLLVSVVFVRDTRGHAAVEARLASPQGATPFGFAEVLRLTSWRNRSLFAACQAGLMNNLNDGVVWGLVPILLTGTGLPLGQVTIVASVYPGVWGMLQLGTGALSDRWGRKWMIAAGMWVQAAGIALFVAGRTFGAWIAASVLLGLGTALVYPTLLAAVSDVAHPDWRATAVGVYRLWRDGGYVLGALLAGLLADWLGLPVAIGVVAGLTLLSGIGTAVIMIETLPSRRAAPAVAS